MDPNMQTDNFKREKCKILVAASMLLLTLFILLLLPDTVKADTGSITVKEINYINSTITLQVNAADTKVYFSDSKKTTWESVPGAIGSDRTITMDISWISPSKNYVITFKGDSSTNVVSVTLPKQVTNFKATYNKVKGTVTFTNTGIRTIEWRKKGSSVWETVDTGTISTKVGYLYNNGATVYFRLAPVNGTSATNVGYRASKEVSVAITKRASAPSVTIDGSAFNIAVKKGMAYRTVNSDSTTTEWTNITYTTKLLLEDIAAKAMYTDSSSTQSTVTLQFRTNATSSTQVSKITTITVPVQAGPPSIDTYGISLSYTSSSTVSLQVKAASTSVPFEYSIVEKDEELDYQTAKWTSITSSAAVAIDSKNATKGSHIYVRLKSVAETSSTDFALASKEIEVSTTGGLTYPDAPEATTLTTLITTAGVCSTDNSSSYLSFTLYSATSTTVSSIKFLDAYGITKGTVSCKSSVVKNTSSVGTDDKYIITTKITSTGSLDSTTGEFLYAEITMANSDVITSSDTAGIRLYLYPASYINNPDDDDDYTQSFKRIYLSTEARDDSTFKFQLDFGTSYIPDSSTVNSYTGTATAINSLKYDGYTLNNGTDYNIEYGTYVNEDDKTVTKATVTVYVDKFERSSLIDTTDTALPLVITLNNGEILNDDIYISLVSTAIMNNTPIAWSITEGSLDTKKTSTVTNSDGSTTTVTEDVITYTITLTLFDSSYSVGVSDVTWGGTSIFGSATITGGKATIYLSNAKINKLTTTSSDTKNIVIILSNGFTISTGCKLTILDAS